MKDYGDTSREMLRALRDTGKLKGAAFEAFARENGFDVTENYVKQWVAGLAHLPADVLPLLARFVGEPEVVFGPYHREAGAGFELRGVGSPEAPPARKALRVAVKELAGFIADAADALDDDEIDETERRRMLARIAWARMVLSALERALTVDAVESRAMAAK